MEKQVTIKVVKGTSKSGNTYFQMVVKLPYGTKRVKVFDNDVAEIFGVSMQDLYDKLK